MKLKELLKHDTIESIHEDGKYPIPSWFRNDKYSGDEVEEKLASYKQALAKYKEAGNAPMATKMAQRIKDMEARQKEGTHNRVQAN